MYNAEAAKPALQEQVLLPILASGENVIRITEKQVGPVLQGYRTMFETVRLVDPEICMQVSTTKESHFVQRNEDCFALWGKSRRCERCISQDAVRTGKVQTKVEPIGNDVYYVFCVQEELGCRGSKPTAARIKPDIGIAVDITPAHDYPCDLEGSNEVDGGIGIKICDPSVVCDEDVVAAMEKACEDNHIKYQREVIDKGGTDASSMNLSGYGVKAGGIVVTTRYPHSQSAVASKADIEAGVDLMTAFSKTGFTF